MNAPRPAGAAVPGSLAAQQAQRSELAKAFDPHYPDFRRIFIFSLIAGLLVLSPSVYMLEVYDRVVNSRNHWTLASLTVIVLVAYLVMEGLEWVRGEMLHHVSDAIDRKINPRLFNLVFEAGLKKQPGGSTQLLSDWRVIKEFLNSPFVPSVMDVPVAIIFAILVYLINPALGVVTTISAMFQVFVTYMTQKTTQPPLQEANMRSAMAQQYADSTIRNAEVVEAMGMVRSIHGRWLRMQRQFLKLQAKASVSAGGYQAASKMITQLLGSALLGLGCFLHLGNFLNGGPGMMIVASIIGGRAMAPLAQLVAQWRLLINARESWDRLNAMLEANPVKPPAMALPAPKGALTVEQLVAGAPVPPGAPSTPIVRGIQFALQPGETVAVIGPSASGKTTLARLLMGLWPAMSGKVRLDGVDIYNWNKAELGPYLGYLPQGVELFEGTVAENIARFGTVDMAKVKAAAELVGMASVIEQLPKGYDTYVGRDGAVLSGGQRQRVALARALYGDPAFVVLDEPNASLDEAGDAALLETLKALKARGATVVVITHRTTVFGVVDKLLLLMDGAQQAFGPRDDVLAALQKARQQAAAAQQQQQAAAAAARQQALPQGGAA